MCSGEAFCRIIEIPLMIIIDNGFRKRGTNGMCNCVFARREGHKSELQGRGTRFLGQAYKNQYERFVYS